MADSLTLRWVDEKEREKVALTRLRSFGAAGSTIEKYRGTVAIDLAAPPRHFLLAELDNDPVGTATSLDLTMWIRGRSFPCQGVAYVGTVKTHRRLPIGPAKGIATQVMNETLRFARDRGHVLTALMPFRVSYYEHFGYGIVEDRAEWTLPLSILPAGDPAGFRFFTESDLPALMSCHQRIVKTGQCDIERPESVWRQYLSKANDGFLLIDRPNPAGPIHGWLTLLHIVENDNAIIKVTDRGADSPDALIRQLSYLHTLRDQYSAAQMILPADLPLNLLLKEHQIPHRPVTHPTASCRPFTRMQLRILDPIQFLDGLNLDPAQDGQITIAIAEPEGHTTKLDLQIDYGHCTAAPSDAAPDLTLPAHLFASIATGHLNPTLARSLNLFICNESTLQTLQAFTTSGPRPFTHEYF